MKTPEAAVTITKSNKDRTANERYQKHQLRKILQRQKQFLFDTKVDRRNALTSERKFVQSIHGQLHEQYNSKDNSSSSSDSKDSSIEGFATKNITNLQHQRNREELETGTSDVNFLNKRKALELKSHMRHGTQSVEMFQNEEVLWEYTQTKFFSRAMLVAESLNRLNPVQKVWGVDNEESFHPQSEMLSCHKRQAAWDQLLSIKSACSIACGPGSDIVGLLALLKVMSKSFIPLKRLAFMDWAIYFDETIGWGTVLHPLKHVLVPGFIDQVDMAMCDVTKSLLSHPVNHGAMELLLNRINNEESNASQSSLIEDELEDQQKEAMLPNNHKTNNHDLSLIRAERTQMHFDLYLVSHVLTETHSQWEPFFCELISHSKPGTLFYFCEPSAWQLHLVKQLCSNYDIEFWWLDSSMGQCSDIQDLDLRVGPGVLLGMKQ